MYFAPCTLLPHPPPPLVAYRSNLLSLTEMKFLICRAVLPCIFNISDTNLSLYIIPWYHMISTGDLVIYLNKKWEHKLKTNVTESKL